jgi:hypothetical protein
MVTERQVTEERASVVKDAQDVQDSRSQRRPQDRSVTKPMYNQYNKQNCSFWRHILHFNGKFPAVRNLFCTLTVSFSHNFPKGLPPTNCTASIVTGYVQKVEFLFSISCRPALEPIQSPIQWVPAVLSPKVKRPGRRTEYSRLQLVPRSRKRESLHPLICKLSWLSASLVKRRESCIFYTLKLISSYNILSA